MRPKVKRHTPWVLALAVYALYPSAFAQTFVTPKGEAQNVRFEQREEGMVHIFYDLIASDPRAVFSVRVEASSDGGATFGIRPQTATGDVGSSVTPGVGKRIVWDAGKDVERVQLDRFRFRIVATGGPLATEPTIPVPTSAKPSVDGVLTITTKPAGAQINIDGVSRGVAPLKLTNLTPGPHRVVTSLAGYLNNSRTVEILAGKDARVDIDLTEGTTTASAAPAKKGGRGKIIAIGAGGAGAAAAVALAAGGGSKPGPTGPTGPVGPSNRNPVISQANIDGSLTTALASATRVRFDVTATDADNDQLTATFNFGDGTNSSAPLSNASASATKVFNNAGGVGPTVTVSDGRGGSATASFSQITIGTVTGIWTGQFEPSVTGGFRGISLTQNASAVTGTGEDQFRPQSPTVAISGSVADPRRLILRFTYADGSFYTVDLAGSSDLRTFRGTFTGVGSNPFTLVKQ